MNKYLQCILGMGIIFLLEATPFLYNDAYTWADMKWGWIIGMPLVWLVWAARKERREKEES